MRTERSQVEGSEAPLPVPAQPVQDPSDEPWIAWQPDWFWIPVEHLSLQGVLILAADDALESEA